jgi:hypothetical protein
LFRKRGRLSNRALERTAASYALAVAAQRERWAPEGREGRVPDETAIVAKPIDAVGQLYQRRALEALPILVRQAWSGQPIYYWEIARELGMTNPRNMNYVLGSVGTSLRNLSKRWNEPIPPLQVLAINVGDNLPGEGFAEFTFDSEAFRRASPYVRRRLVEALTAQVRAFPRWRDVLAEFGAPVPRAESLEQLLPRDVRAAFGGRGESEAHRLFKKFVADHPAHVEVFATTVPPDVEYCLPSGDAVDVLFTTRTSIVAVEVKSQLSPEADLLRGIFQCVKYRAILDAVGAIEQRELATKAVLAIEGCLPESLRTIATTLGVPVFENLGLRPDAV